MLGYLQSFSYWCLRLSFWKTRGAWCNLHRAGSKTKCSYGIFSFSTPLTFLLFLVPWKSKCFLHYVVLYLCHALSFTFTYFSFVWIWRCLKLSNQIRHSGAALTFQKTNLPTGKLGKLGKGKNGLANNKNNKIILHLNRDTRLFVSGFPHAFHCIISLLHNMQQWDKIQHCYVCIISHIKRLSKMKSTKN